MKYLGLFSILFTTVIVASCGQRPEPEVNPPLNAECAKNRSKCQTVALGKSGDVLTDEDAPALELTINRKSDNDERPNLIQLGTVEAGIQIVKAFSILRTDQGRLSLLKVSPTGVCDNSSLPKIQFQIYEAGELVVETSNLFKDVVIDANKKYLLRVKVKADSRCENSQIQFVAGYETDGREIPLEVNGKGIGGNKSKARGFKAKNPGVLMCEVKSTANKFDKISKLEIDLKQPVTVTLIDGSTRIPFVNSDLLCGANVSSSADICDYSKSGGSQTRIVRTCQNREVQITLNSDKSGRVACQGDTQDDSMIFILANCQ